MRIGVLVTAVVAVLALAGCGSAEEPDAGVIVGPPRTTSTTTLPDLPEVPAFIGLAVEDVAGGFSEPVAIAPVPSVDETFVVERTGRIVPLYGDGSDAVLDLTEAIGWEMNEQGLLGFAVHPRFPSDPRGFAVYTDLDFDLQVVSFEWDGSVFDRSTEQRVLEVPQPHKYHQGGGILFGPTGYLWMSFGDGGGIGDRYENGQDATTLQGTIVRIDIDHGEPYAIPPDNPWLGSEEGADEVWAIGLRNPWRFAIDGDWLLIADVGQYEAEEVNVVGISDAALNFGWPIMEADDCFDAPSCVAAGFTPPNLIVPHNRACAIIGGPVYRGTAIPELHGHYLYGDHCVGWLRSAPHDAGELGSVSDWEGDLGSLGRITSIDVDHRGELLVANLDGDIVRIVAERDEP